MRYKPSPGTSKRVRVPEGFERRCCSACDVRYAGGVRRCSARTSELTCPSADPVAQSPAAPLPFPYHAAVSKSLSTLLSLITAIFGGFCRKPDIGKSSTRGLLCSRTEIRNPTRRGEQEGRRLFVPRAQVRHSPRVSGSRVAARRAVCQGVVNLPRSNRDSRP
jgi:hypothetical protein